MDRLSKRLFSINRLVASDFVWKMESFKDLPIERTVACSLLEAAYLLVLSAHGYPPETKTLDSVFNVLSVREGQKAWDHFFDADCLSYAEQICVDSYTAFSLADDKVKKNASALLLYELRHALIASPALRTTPLKDVQTISNLLWNIYYRP